MKTSLRAAAIASILAASLLASGLPAAAQDAPAAPAPSSGGPDDAVEAARKKAVADFEADERLGARLSQVPGEPRMQTQFLLDLVWSEAETDAEIKAAAKRRLHDTDPRIIVSVVTRRIAVSPPDEQIGMLDLTREIYTRIGGSDATVDEALADTIRDKNERVAAKAIAVCSELGIQAAYLPMREAASTPGSPVREQAIEAIGRIHDPRAIVFFKKLLESDGAPREVLYRGLGQIGRPAALLLKEKMMGPLGQDRDLACDALLGMANGDDLSTLYAYIQKFPPQGERKKRIYDTIATLEAHGNERPAGSGD